MSETNYAERRQCERTQIEKEVILTTAPKATGRYHDGVTVDLSSQGARVRSKVVLTPGESVEITVPDGQPDLPYVMMSQVVWWSEGEAGLKFAEPVQMKTTQKLGRSMTA